MALLNRVISPEEEYQKNLATLEGMRLLDDTFMREAFRNNLELAQYMLRIIIDKPDLILTKEETQYDLKHLLKVRSITLDVFGVDSEGRQYDFEVQKENSGAIPHSARYHSAAMDVDNLKVKGNFKDLPDTYVIFFTENDIFKKGKPIYRIERVNLDADEMFNDGEHIIYINGSYNNIKDNSELAKLIHDFRCSKAEEMLLKPFAERVGFLKNSQKGFDFMCKLMEDRINEGRVQERIMLAANLLQEKVFTIEKISELTKLPIDMVQQIEAELKGISA